LKKLFLRLTTNCLFIILGVCLCLTFTLPKAPPAESSALLPIAAEEIVALIRQSFVRGCVVALSQSQTRLEEVNLDCFEAANAFLMETFVNPRAENGTNLFDLDSPDGKEQKPRERPAVDSNETVDS
jgi:hypothetical protein